MNDHISYCISAFCNQQVNELGIDTCANCGSSLLINKRYRLINKLTTPSKSAKARVFEALDIQTQEQVILKLFDFPGEHEKNLEQEHEFLYKYGKRFWGQLIGKENFFRWEPNPNIPGYVITGLCLPKIEGINSQQWIEQHGPLNEDQAIQWIQRFLPHLESLSELAYIHRDIKPTNIIIGPDESLTLIDFESIIKIDQEYQSLISGWVVNEKKHDYQSLNKVYSAGFTPTEQIEGLPVPQSDFYALGRTVLFWLTGKTPYLLKGRNVETLDWLVEAPHLSQAFINFLVLLCHSEASKRFQRIQDISGYLENEYPRILHLEKHPQSKTLKFVIYGLLGITALVLGIFGYSRYLYALGSQALIEEDFDVAKALLNRSLSIDRSYVPALHNLGKTCLFLGDYSCALGSFQAAIKQNSRQSSSFYLLGLLMDKQEKPQLAKVHYQRAIEIRPNNTEALNRLGRLHIRFGDYQAAKDVLNQALSYTNDNELVALINKNLGWIAYLEKNYQTSKMYLTKSIDAQAERADAFCLMAKNNEALNLSAQAITYWKACLSLSSDRPEANDWKDTFLEKTLNTLP